MKNNTTRFFQHSFLLVCFVILESCSTRVPVTNITGSWKDPEGKSYKEFLVAALSKNLPARSSFEGDISKNLNGAGVKSSKSLDVLGENQKLETPEEKKAAVEKIQSMDYDAIIVITLLRKTEENRYVKGTSSYTPTSIGTGTGYYDPVTRTGGATGSYGAFGVYYMDASSAYNTPGYYETDKIYFVQCNLYDAKSTKLVWSAQSETFNPGNLATASHDFAFVMVEALKKAGLIYKEPK